ncbi:MAG: sialate O-acetylesterase [Lentisphaeria bacterium]|nr:sialate O-acetylesterase [Lentisphaeria bacterium]
MWYQGESNQNDRRSYQPKLEALITGWREAWGLGDVPFYYVQLPGLRDSPTDNPAMGDGRAEIRQAYVEALRLPNTGLAVTIDIGTKGEHPPNKYDTGDRLARTVLRNVYGFKEIGVSPLYKSHKIEGRSIRISFSDAESGLMLAEKQGPVDFGPPTPTPDTKLGWLSIQDAAGTWHRAEGNPANP